MRKESKIGSLFVAALMSVVAMAEVPQNAIDLGGSWMCKNGYKKQGDACKKVHVPVNAIAIGDRWMCKNGFKKVGETCQAITLPDNAIAIGENWICKNGFKKVEENCEKFAVPKNAIAIGDKWQCLLPYKRKNDSCVEKSYAELVNTIKWLSIEAGSNLCDDFYRSCDAECTSHECSNACEEGKSECEYNIGNLCDDAKDSCESSCWNLESDEAQYACQDACSAGERSCS